MKKLVATLATSVIIAGTIATTTSAEEIEVQKGDSLWDIANEHNTTIEELVDINELKSTVIQPKQTISTTDNNDNETYVVEKGDTLNGISNEFDVTVDNLKEWNDLSSDIIGIGQELSIDGANVEQEEAPEATDEKETTEATTTQNSNESNQSESAESSEPKAENTAAESDSNEQENDSGQKADGETISVSATAYTANCDGCSGLTSTGIDLNANPDKKVIAVDPSVIPLGSEVYVEGYGHAVAGDVGGAINGNKIDVHVSSDEEASDWGVRTVDVTIVE
ncbi:LysM peptidoglycan-binding domain-containing protein [Virgibacillus sp. NKC19-3]|uniref:3D domain-containing protein n=1 Tax=Virgibacillus saliphilus TaxID=2831674 RepID=UPI001C9B3C56|nr:3D domain-containing protein [Virgibacillus sp. NKC19-3]MBY7144866.1 LysM peptidoglycan-binding domain-containing protein [Virgibacillus sp. NKC19-3]